MNPENFPWINFHNILMNFHELWWISRNFKEFELIRKITWIPLKTVVFFLIVSTFIKLPSITLRYFEFYFNSFNSINSLQLFWISLNYNKNLWILINFHAFSWISYNSGEFIKILLILFERILLYSLEFPFIPTNSREYCWIPNNFIKTR